MLTLLSQLSNNYFSMHKLALELQLNMEINDEGKTIVLRSPDTRLTGRQLMLTEGRENVAVSEFLNSRLTRVEHWLKVEWSQFYEKMRAMCEEYFR